MIFGKKIKELREEHGMVQRKLAAALDIDTPMYSKIERTIKADGKVIMDDNDKADDKRTIIIEYIHRKGEAKTEDLVKLLGSSTTRIKVLLYQLVDEGILVSCGGNRNRTYKLKEQEES